MNELELLAGADARGRRYPETNGARRAFPSTDAIAALSAFEEPLLEVRRGAHEVRDVQNIADILIDPEGALERRNHWEKTSHALLVGAIPYVQYAKHCQ